MPQKIRLWEVLSNNSPKEIEVSTINLESELEDLLVQDISILDPNLLVLGSQVTTAYGQTIDLLCMDRKGDLVIVELKKNKTPRDVVSQALEYAYWVRDLNYEDIIKITTNHFEDNSLEDEFNAKFDEDLPDNLNNSHRSIIVANEIDSHTEQIVHYLSDIGVPINSATFEYYEADDGRNYIAQVYQIELDFATKKGRSKRRPAISMEELYERLKLLNRYDLFQEMRTLGASIVRFSQAGNKMRVIPNVSNFNRAILMLDLFKEPDIQGIPFRFNGIRTKNLYSLQSDNLNDIFPSGTESMDSVDWSGATREEKNEWVGFKGVFSSVDEFKPLVELLQDSA